MANSRARRTVSPAPRTGSPARGGATPARGADPPTRRATSPAGRTTGPTRRRQRLEHDERRRQILACARKLFSERNYAAVSTWDIADEAGVARGLLHHYFGTKRDLYLEVVRKLVRMPSNPVPLHAGPGIEPVIEQSVDRWLAMLERNRGTWLAAIGAQGLGRDPEVEAILDEARELAADRLIEALQTNEAAHAPRELRASMRAYSGFAEAASVEWLERGRLTRVQVRAMLVQGFLSIVRDVLPALQRAESPGAKDTEEPSALSALTPSSDWRLA